MKYSAKVAIALIALTLANLSTPASANPTAPTVVNGSATLANPNASTLEITNTRGTIINWQGFSINTGEVTRFLQPDAASAVLNRVTGSNPSQIFGALQSNGRVFLINPNGILFGAGAAINVQDLIASTLNISDSDFLNGTYNFSQTGVGGNIVLQSGAQIATANGGQVWLLAKNINQDADSSITTPTGNSILAAGTNVQVAESALGNMVFNVTTDGTNNIQTLGNIAAEKGVAGLFADNITIADNIATQKKATITTSATGTGNGGLIVMNANNKLEIQRLAEVSADGGTEGGNGGTIRLTASNLSISQIANGMGNLHASARHPSGVNGTVTLTETGTFNYQPNGTEFQVNTTTAGNQGALPSASGGGFSKITVLANGRFIVTWAGAGTGDDSGVFGQLYEANGTPVAAEFRINSTTSLPQGYPSVTALKNGNFVVTWSGSGGGLDSNVYGRLFDNNGTALSTQFLINTNTNNLQAASSVTALANGGFVVSWASNGQDGSSWGVYAQRYEANGNKAGNEFRINTTTAGNQGGSQGVGSITALPDGGFIAIWASQGQDASPVASSAPNKSDNAFGVYAQRYDGNGNKTGGEFLVNTTTQLSQQLPKITGLPNGGFVATWLSDDDLLPTNTGLQEAIYAQRFDVNGSKVGNEFRVNTYNSLDQETPAITSLADGGFVISWESLEQDGNGRGVYGQRYNAQGAAVGGEFRLNTTTNSNQMYSDVVGLADGGFIASWSSYSQDAANTWGVFSQRYKKEVLPVTSGGMVTSELGPTAAFNTRPNRPNANYVPIANPITLNLSGDAPSTPINITTPTDGDADPLTITVNALPNVSNGTVFLSDGVTPVTAGQSLTVSQLTGLTFKPTTPSASGMETFSYTVVDGQGGIVPQTAIFNITPVTLIQPDVISTNPGNTQTDVISTNPGNTQTDVISAKPGNTQTDVISAKPGNTQTDVISAKPGNTQTDVISAKPGNSQPSLSKPPEVEQELAIAHGVCNTAERGSAPANLLTPNRELCKDKLDEQPGLGEAKIKVETTAAIATLSKEEQAYAKMVGQQEYALTRGMSWKARQAYWQEHAQKQSTLSAAEYAQYQNKVRSLSTAERSRYYEQLAR
ncbi:filamentous hemagglutinin N-terminal domain-containing protein [Microcoleus sp. FACHB-831]|uniref:two-partner secretion domain-containing protein n=1 Tax=Microcoleus sp. FACHB-831 TaxID=2692827 RepID=UPI001688A77E|nr:filamentous hemagglutinin N-terminal domain-containing protein [Microcoleus sp. FACHB-831]MBD1922047.1 filamentous hemagglutinin N-terminal domain-containing protein [Microcoleus sp. FACHB-831]